MNAAVAEVYHIDPSSSSKALILLVVRRLTAGCSWLSPSAEIVLVEGYGPSPGTACIQWLVDAKISEPTPLGSVQDISEGLSQLQSSDKIGCNLSATTYHFNLFLSRVQFLLLVYRYCSQEQSLMNLLHQILVAVSVSGERNLK